MDRARELSLERYGAITSVALAAEVPDCAQVQLAE
jgi:hypothetical protein